ncbi:MAG: hypothetical protein K8T25_05405, partial [Planctomycetia bacterium]|nr:hypothetical protein [Planctomycetia bacterium]
PVTPPPDTANLPELNPEKPEVAFQEPEEVVKSSQEQISTEAVAKSKPETDVREERIKKEVLQDYKTLAPATGDGAAAADPASGKLCWRAFTCTHPKCSGQGKNGNPYLFAYRYDGVTLGPNGQPDWSQNAAKEPMTMLGVCPACGRANTVAPYYPPDIAQQAREIDKKVNRIKAAITAAMRQGGQAPSAMFTELDETLKQRAALPVYYLCD